jgi:ubiquinone/menaquinone biosynthesis C-methylase UbiE
MGNPQMQAQGPAAIFQMLNAAQATAVLSAAVELDAFTPLAEGPLDANAVAERIKCPPRSTRILLNALAVLGLVEKQGAKYKLSPLADQHLVRGRPMYFGDSTGILSHPMMWNGLSRFAEAVRHDGTVQEAHAETPKHPFWEVFAKSSGSMSHGAAMALDAIVGDFVTSRENPRMLDVAAGSGIYGYTMVKNHANLSLTTLDWPNVLAESKTWADKMGIDKARVRYVEGNLFDTEFGGPYDLVLMSHIYHHFDPPTCLALTRKAAKALAPGGKLVVHEFLSDEDNAPGVMFSVTMLVWTRHGEAYGAADYKKWFAEAGLKGSTVHPSLGMPTTFLMAER